MTNICFAEAKEKYNDILRANICKGNTCPNYATCSARMEFDALPKRTPTDYEIQEAVRRERIQLRYSY